MTRNGNYPAILLFRMAEPVYGMIHNILAA